MKKFEYKTVEIVKQGFWKSRFDVVEIDKILNGLGKEGWELICVEDKNVGYGVTDRLYYTFKREV